MSEELDALVRNDTWELVPPDLVLWVVSGSFESNAYLVVLWIGTMLGWLPRVSISDLAMIIMTPSVRW